MTVLLDTSVLIDFLRGRAEARTVVESLEVPPVSSEICRVELLQGLRPHEQANADELAALIDWIPVVEPIAVRAGELGRLWRPSHSGIGTADLIIAATAELAGAALLTLNVRHFPMFEGLKPAY
ncbi:MAG TPA: PIN domain-containing protein [Microbacteriaceae bacterium]